tara:strand:+ start:663 stop:935 length:273 start_codon:yes stop_codon:yes gene_type:complete
MTLVRCLHCSESGDEIELVSRSGWCGRYSLSDDKYYWFCGDAVKKAEELKETKGENRPFWVSAYFQDDYNNATDEELECWLDIRWSRRGQ